MNLIPVEARFPDLHQVAQETFSDLQVEMVECELCGEYHPPELHAQRFVTPYDPSEPEDV